MMRIKPINRGALKTIAERMECSYQSVSYALNFKKHSMMSRRIRHMAMNELRSVIM